MSKLYRSREGEATTVDTKTQLTTLGSETAPGPLLVPAMAKILKGIIVAACSNFAQTASCSGFVRLEGPGLKEGPEVIGVTAEGVPVATGGNLTIKAQYYELNAPVTAAQEILIFGESAGGATARLSFGVTLVFSS